VPAIAILQPWFPCQHLPFPIVSPASAVDGIRISGRGSFGLSFLPLHRKSLATVSEFLSDEIFFLTM
jgi:hypothetical protein